MREILNVSFIIFEYFIEYTRALRWSKSSPLCPKENKLYYDIILLAHTVEKGLSVENPRMKFGKSKIPKLLKYLDEYNNNWDKFPVEKSFGCLSEYIELHKMNNIDLGNFGKNIEKFIEKCQKNNLEKRGGTKMIHPIECSNLNFYDGLISRYSSRQYLPKILDNSVLEKIIDTSLRTPSQCNRQSGRIHYYSDKNKIDNLLKLQAGAEGFREEVYNLLIITSDITAWSGFKARNQAFVDGSLLAMQVLNSCSALNIAYCPLNLAVSNLKEFKIIKEANIPPNEKLIMMISIGYPKDKNFVVAKSERIQKEKLFINHGN